MPEQDENVDSTSAFTEHEFAQLRRGAKWIDRVDAIVRVSQWAGKALKWLFHHLKFVAAAMKWAGAVAPVLLVAEALGWLDLSEQLGRVIGLLQ